MAVNRHDELPEATQREAELLRQIDDMLDQVTRLHRTREETNPKLSPEFNKHSKQLKQSVEHSKQLEQSAEKLSQLEVDNLTLRDENQALNAASNKKRRFRTRVRLMPTLETPNSGTGAISQLRRREECWGQNRSLWNQCLKLPENQHGRFYEK